MRGIPGVFLSAAVAAACSSASGGSGRRPDPVISVGGTYQTEVTIVSNDCPGQTVEQHPTVVSHAAGATALSLTHAGSSYDGTLAPDGSFSTAPLTQVFSGVGYRISITGQPPCSFTARWAGPKSGSPNVIP